MQNVDVDLDLNFSKVWGVFGAGILVRHLSVFGRDGLEDLCAVLTCSTARL